LGVVLEVFRRMSEELKLATCLFLVKVLGVTEEAALRSRHD
jgi:hypothetical protein